MLAPLKPLLCRHEFYWSERHGADRCHRCGKTQAADAIDIPPARPGRGDGLPSVASPAGPQDHAFFDIPAMGFDPAPAVEPLRRLATPKALKTQALERRERLLALLDRIADGGQPSRQDTLDALLGVIEDAHSADPVLFGADAAGRFARLHEARGGLIF